MFAGSAGAAEPPSLDLRRVETARGAMLVLPSSAGAAEGAASVDGVAVRVSTEHGIRTYRARIGERTVVAHADAQGRPVRYALDIAEGRFRALASTVRVALRDERALPALVRELGADSGKAYPQLGFALIRLPSRMDPAAAVARLADMPGVDGAALQFQAPRRRPTRPPPRPRLPFPITAKSDLAADLIVFFDGVRVTDENTLTAEVGVWNWGGAATSASAVSLILSASPRLSPELSRVSRRVPELDPKRGFSFSIPVDIERLAPGAYFLYAFVPEQDAELPGRGYTNSDRAGFVVDFVDGIRQRCPALGRGGAPDVEDPLFAHQWHLRNTGQRAFADRGGLARQDLRLGSLLSSGPTGAGVTVAVVDTGLETCHPDLAANVEVDASYNFNAELATAAGARTPWPAAETADPFNVHPTGDHGTSVAGLIGAEARNGIGGRGVAPGVRLRGYNMLSALDYGTDVVLDSLGASRFAPDSSSVDVFNMSYGSLGYPWTSSPTEEALFAHGVRRLRDGRGAVYVKSAGNGFGQCRALRDPLNSSIGCASANGDDTNNLPYMLVVGGLDASGKRASYASVGANLWVSAPAGEFGVRSPAMFTADQAGHDAGYGTVYGDRIAGATDVNPDGDYTSSFNGTSAAAPNAAGVVALLLEENPGLTWRDVKHILARTARRVDSLIRPVAATFGDVRRTVQDRWITNDAGYRFHNWYGFGAIDANAAWRLARDYVGDSLGSARRSGWYNATGGALRIPDDDGRGARRTLRVGGLSATANIEAVILELDLDHPFLRDLGIELISPAGTRSIVNPVFNEVLAFRREGAPLRWRVLSNAFYGEGMNGTWRIGVFDGAADDVGSLAGWRLRFHYGEHP